MKKFYAAAAAFVLALSISGCSNINDKDSLVYKETTAATSSAAKESDSSSQEGSSTDESSSQDDSSSKENTSEQSSDKADSSEKDEKKDDQKQEDTPKKDNSVKAILSEMTLEEKVCQMFIVTPESLTGDWQTTYVDEPLEQALKKYPVGGVILFSYNLTDGEQAKSLISDMQKITTDTCDVGMFVAVDEEGGFVARCADALGTTTFDDMAVYGAENDRNKAVEIGSTIAKDISSFGFNLDFAPVTDVNIDPNNELGSRIFSSDPDVVGNMASGVVEGLQDNGVCATLKHFPGLGAENGNTHTNDYVVIDRTVEQLRETELIPFKQAIDSGAAFVMVGHQIVTGFGDELPCDLSYKCVTEILRNELGFEGIAITDSQLMNTISNVYSSGDAAKKSILAGIDVILIPANVPEAISAVVDAVNSGEISEERIDESVTRILTQKKKLGLI